MCDKPLLPVHLLSLCPCFVSAPAMSNAGELDEVVNTLQETQQVRSQKHTSLASHDYI